MRAFLIIFSISIVFIVAAGVFNVRNKLNVTNQIMKMVQETPRLDETKYFGEVTTGYPDATPSIGIQYLSASESDQIFTFYKNIMNERGWKVIKELNDSDPNLAKIVKYKVSDKLPDFFVYISKVEGDPQGKSLVSIKVEI